MPELTDAAGLVVATPAYPTLQATLAVDHAVLDDRRLDPAAGQDPRECLVAALAGRARELRGEHGSIRARVATPDGMGVGGEFSAVVTAAGQVIDTTGTGATAASRGGRARRRSWLAAAAALVAVLAVAATAVLVVTRGDRHERSAPAPRPAAATGTPTVYPRRPPSGFSGVAAWSATVESGTRPVAAPGGLVVSATREAVQARHVGTGQVAWQAPLPSSAQTAASAGGLHVATIDGHSAVVTTGADQLFWWPVNGRAHRRHTVALPGGATVSYAGATPLVTIPGQHAALVTGDRMADRVVPAGATALAGAGRVVLAADTAGHVWRLTPQLAEFPSTPVDLVAPAGGQGPPRVTGMAGGLLVTTWTTKDPKRRIVALSDPRSGRPIAAQPVAAEGITAAAVHSSPDGQLAVLGDVVLDIKSREIRQVSGLSPWIALNGLVYGVDDHQHPVVLGPSGRSRPAGGGAVPVVLSRGWAVVTSTVGSRTRMYALRADGKPGQSSPATGTAAGMHPSAGDGSAPTPVAPSSATRPPAAPANPTPKGRTP